MNKQNRNLKGEGYISVIVTTYNWPEALNAVLQGLADQTDKNFEIIVADDGSREETALLLQGLQKKIPIPIKHIWQPDEGFRAAAIRNKAIQAATGDYIIFLDGDCIPRPEFIAMQRNLAEPGFFVVGHRILLTKVFSQKVLAEKLPIHRWSLLQWLVARFLGYCNRISSLISFPFKLFRKLASKQWSGAKGCNLAVWKIDLEQVNGWEELYTGWGYEDSDLVIRLIISGVKRKSGRFLVPVIHLWHQERNRDKARENFAMLQLQCKQLNLGVAAKKVENTRYKSKQGLKQCLEGA